MILSHRHRFVFVKTAKTASTSVQIALSRACGPHDVVTPTMDPRHDLVARNHRGRCNPLPELATALRAGITPRAIGTKLMLLGGERFTAHAPAWIIRHRARDAWAEYVTFCVERDPWEKVVSGLSWVRAHRQPDVDVDTYLDYVERRIARGYPGTGVCPYNFSSYTDPRTGEVMVDRILRFEDLEAELRDLCALLGLDVPELPRAYGDVRRLGAAAEVLTGRQIARVGALFAPEIRLHGYTPPS